MPSLRSAVADPPSAFDSAIEAAASEMLRAREMSAASPVSLSEFWTFPPTRTRNPNACRSSAFVNPARWDSLRSTESIWPPYCCHDLPLVCSCLATCRCATASSCAAPMLALMMVAPVANAMKPVEAKARERPSALSAPEPARPPRTSLLRSFSPSLVALDSLRVPRTVRPCARASRVSASVASRAARSRVAALAVEDAANSRSAAT